MTTNWVHIRCWLCNIQFVFVLCWRNTHYDLLHSSSSFFFFKIIYSHLIYHGICLKIITLHFSLIQSLPDGCLKEVLNQNKYLQLRARWRGRLWHFISFSFLWKHSLAVSLPIYLSVRGWAWGIQPDALEGAGEGRNQSPWLILLTMLSLGERQAVANGLRVGAGSRDFDQCSEGGSYFALGQNCCNLNCLSEGRLCASVTTAPALSQSFTAVCTHTPTDTRKRTFTCTNTGQRLRGREA